MIYHFWLNHITAVKQMKKRLYRIGLLIGLSLLLGAPSFAQDKIRVVASFSILGDMVQQVGGEAVDLTVLVGPNEDAHVYRPTPRVVRQIQQSDLIVLNGLGYEGWFPRLMQSSGYQGGVVTVTDGITPLHGGHEHGHHDDGDEEEPEHDINPHAWHSLPNAAVYVTNIEQALSEIRPEKASDFHQRAEQYRSELKALDQQVKLALSHSDLNKRVISTHDAFGYITAEYGIEFLAPQGVSTEAEPSAKDVALLIRQIKQADVKAVFIENITDNRLIEQISRETGVDVYGELYSDALSDQGGNAATYLDMMRYNLTSLINALAQ